MGKVHEILEANGKDAAIQAGVCRGVVEAARLYMSDEDGGLLCLQRLGTVRTTPSAISR